MSEKHTSGPLFFDEGAYELCLDDRDGLNVTPLVATVEFDNVDDEAVAVADGHRLALCWNSHDDLVTALKGFNLTEDMIVSGSASHLTLRVPTEVIQRAASALAKAGA